MKVFLAVISLMVLMQTDATGKRHKMRTHVRNVQGDDPLLEVEPIPPDTMIGPCSCQCCENAPEPLVAPKCANDIIVAVDSSACFRDHHSKMMRFLRRLVRKIGRTPNIQYGGDETRLGLMQFSSDILFPLHLSSFEDYTNPSTRKGLMNGIDEAISSLGFLGEGSFLNKALNATVSHFQNEPRPQALLDQISPTTPRPVVILMTNGKSHPSVTMDDIELSIAGLQAAGVTVIPISVTRECHGVQNEVWNEGLCPDTIILNKLAKVGRGDSSTFMEMKSHD
uniref:VWFA domain-containing protein n=1 Tax=Ciona savignyi TaxID=51511 RepID=H2ZBS5_CIOSA